jgi:integrase
MSKRANGEGSVARRGDGLWEARLSYTDPQTGQRKRRSFYAKTAGEARARLKGARQRLEAGAPVKDSTATVMSWMARWRQTTLAVSDRKESTRSLYASLARKHLEAAPFGAIRLDRLRPTDIEALILTMRSMMKPRPKGPDGKPGDPVRALSDSTIRSTYTVLRSALDAAVRDGLIARNPAALVTRPSVARQEARHLDDADLGALLEAVKESRYYPVLRLVAATGMRRGETLALSWSAVDLDAGLLRVAGTLNRIDGALVISEPKSARSRRVIPLSEAMVTMLKKHRKDQLAERLRAGDQWTDTGLVFTTELGTAVDPRNLLRVVQSVAKRLGLGGVGIHTMRHSLAVSLLEDNVHIRAVADLLGHSSIAVTGDTYGHTSDDAARKAIEGRSARLGF